MARLDRATALKLYDEQLAQKKSVDSSLQRDLEHGWLLRYLVDLDSLLLGRWDYWTQCQLAFELPAEGIPRLDFCSSQNEAAPSRKMLEKTLSAIVGEGGRNGWMGWSATKNVDYLLDWLLFGFGHPGHEKQPEEPQGCGGASMRLYQLFDLTPLLLWPYDHWADMLGEVQHGKHSGFFATPHSICELCTRVTFDDGDHRAKRVCDPCLGTGRMLLHASNYSLRLGGMDIDPTVLKAALVNGYLYAPWMVRPILWLESRPEDEEERVAQAQAESESMMAAAPPHYQERLFDTEFDEQAYAQTAPLIKRRRRATESEKETTLTMDF